MHRHTQNRKWRKNDKRWTIIQTETIHLSTHRLTMHIAQTNQQKEKNVYYIIAKKKMRDYTRVKNELELVFGIQSKPSSFHTIWYIKHHVDYMAVFYLFRFRLSERQTELHKYTYFSRSRELERIIKLEEKPEITEKNKKKQREKYINQKQTMKK